MPLPYMMSNSACLNGDCAVLDDDTIGDERVVLVDLDVVHLATLRLRDRDDPRVVQILAEDFAEEIAVERVGNQLDTVTPQPRCDAEHLTRKPPFGSPATSPTHLGQRSPRVTAVSRRYANTGSEADSAR